MTSAQRIYFTDESYDGQLERTMYSTYGAAADLGEVFATARRLGRGCRSRVRWYEEWTRTAEAARAGATRARENGDPVAAREGFLRASEYFRQAFYFLRGDLDDPRLTQSFDQHVLAFDAAIALMEHPARKVRITYDDTSLVGYFFSPDGSLTERPTLLMPCGYDSTAQTGWFQVPQALERGYNVLLFEGPGQGEALYRQRIFLRPDFEHIIAQIIDWTLDCPGVDRDRVALIGRSFAGYLAPRAATREHRIAGLVCDPAQPNMATKLPTGMAATMALAILPLLMRLSANRNEFFRARMASHGCTTLRSWFDEYQKYTMIDDAASITCPTLLVECEGDFAGGGGPLLFEALRCEKRIINLTAAQGAGGHCAGLGQMVWSAAVYGWLDELLERPLVHRE